MPGQRCNFFSDDIDIGLILNHIDDTYHSRMAESSQLAGCILCQGQASLVGVDVEVEETAGRIVILETEQLATPSLQATGLPCLLRAIVQRPNGVSDVNSISNRNRKGA